MSVINNNDIPAPKSGGGNFVTEMTSLAWSRIAKRRTLAEFSRLMGEGLEPFRRLMIVAKNHREIRRLIATGTDVTFVSSFFRSGNTWMRCLLTDILLQSKGVETATDCSLHRDKVVPDIYYNLVSQRDTTVGNHAFVKTHENYDTIFHACVRKDRSHYAKGGNPRGNVRTLYIYRQPEDSLVSFYHFRILMQSSIAEKVSVDDFCRVEYSTWHANISGHLRGFEDGDPVFFMSYERLLKEPVAAFAAMLQFLELDHTQAAVERAVSNMEFGKLRSLQEGNRSNGSEKFFRRGRQGTGSKELSDPTLNFIREKSAEIVSKANECTEACLAKYTISEAPRSAVNIAH